MGMHQLLLLHAALTGKLTVRPPEPIEDMDDLQKVARAVEESCTGGGERSRTEGRQPPAEGQP